LLLSGWGQDLVELAGDALQPLLALETAAYMGLVQALVQVCAGRGGGWVLVLVQTFRLSCDLQVCD
jgi:hypothetical protein